MQVYELTKEVRALSELKKKVFAILCAERCVRIFDYNYSEGATELSDGIAYAVTCINNASIDIVDLKTAKSKIEGAIPNLDEVGSQHSCAVFAGVSVLNALDSTVHPSDDNIIKSAFSALEAVDSFSEYSGNGLNEEKQWQEELINSLVQTSENELNLTMLRDTLRQTHAGWESDWL